MMSTNCEAVLPVVYQKVTVCFVGSRAQWLMTAKVYLRHVSTKLYFSGWHNWSADVRRAVDFEKREAAVERARREQLSQVEVVIQEGDPD
jgi:hypothetical protein